MNIQSKGYALKQRPAGTPTLDCFELKTEIISEINDGQIIIKNLWLSVDPYMRGRMSDAESYVPPFQLGEIMQGSAIGEVIESKHPEFNVGDKVNSMLGWREYAVSNGEMVQKLPETSLPEQSFLGVAGMPGLTAWVGLNIIAELKEGETVLVSAASGAVGSLVCQFAKLKGCRVIGNAGSTEKVEWLKSLGVDAVINYKDYRNAAELEAALAEHCPNGVDVCYENVGGDHLEAALNLLNRYGRMAVCGMIDLYNLADAKAGPNNLANIVKKSLKIQGFIVSDHWEHYPNYVAQLSQWAAEGKVHWKETTRHGIESTPEAFLGLFKGENIGKMLIQL
ncbi:NADP-dependent oxidoreductase [Vibrio rumoiensis]|uniref:NADP-dependent oxidoreductase n=1 Tax=Vibrio rumoiensis 1S-45 TaxID=1188252 RepID=A0A1E5E0K2_9VIBR|nr:NADP-dependent oxidoreductase [Vibrio rumoiensis]OEF23972.1 NADP-dependent oxidoreductase [Vibrio rumoiensis 1S-45]